MCANMNFLFCFVFSTVLLLRLARGFGESSGITKLMHLFPLRLDTGWRERMKAISDHFCHFRQNISVFEVNLF